MRKTKVKQCRYAISPISGEELFCDVYVLVRDDEQMLFHESMWLVDLSRSHPEETVRSYANDLLSFAKMAEPLGGWSGVTPSIMTGYLHGELFLSRKYKRSTMQRHIASLKRFYQWLDVKGYITSSVDFCWDYEHLYSPKNYSHIDHISKSSLHSTYIAPSTFFETLIPSVIKKNKFIQMRDQICLRLGYECGLRAREVLDLSLEVVRNAIYHAKYENDGLWGTASIPLIGKAGKIRDIFLPPNLCEYISQYLKRYRYKLGNLKGKLLCSSNGTELTDPKYASNVFKTTYLKAGLIRNQKQGFHRLRKSYGTNLTQFCYDKDMDPWVIVPRRMGHKDLSTTLEYIQFDALINQRSEVLSSLNMMSDKFKSLRKEKGNSND